MAAIVKPEKVKELPELVIVEAAVLMVMVPELAVKVAVEELVKVAAILKDEEVVTVAPEAIVKL